jgi:hypothetical protein
LTVPETRRSVAATEAKKEAEMVRSIGAALLVALVLAAAAEASIRASTAAHFVPGALYTGKTCATPPGIPNTGCTFKFRASATGSSLKSIGITVIDSWRCNGGGGEALIGGKAHGATAVPLVHVRATGALYGSIGTGSHRSWVSGTLAAGGRTAHIVFHSGTAAYACHTNAVVLRAAG